MGLDWRLLSLSGYLESLEAANEMNDPKAGKGDPVEVSVSLRRFFKAHAND